MRDDLQRQLYADFPHLFWRSSLPMEETCMCWGLCIGSGWEPLLRELCERITYQAACRANIPLASAGARDAFAFEQVKEQFGELRVYGRHSGGSGMDEALYDDIYRCIEDAEIKARKTCERCGKEGKLARFMLTGWPFMTCPDCVDERVRRGSRSIVTEGWEWVDGAPA